MIPRPVPSASVFAPAFSASLLPPPSIPSQGDGASLMPSKSKKQAKFMAAAAHNAKFAAEAGISQDVAREFDIADLGPREAPKKKRGK